jgi:HlyD family secretion protein
MMQTNRTWLLRGGAVVIVGAILLAGWLILRPKGFGDGVASGNGRIEAVEIDVSAKTPGRVQDVLVDEGDNVKAGQVVAVMDTQTLQAQRAEAQAQLQAALTAVQTAQSQVALRQSDRASALAGVGQREAELNAANKHLARSETLSREGAAPVEERDDDQARVEEAGAALGAARAQVAAADAGIAAAQSQVIGARSNVDAVRASVQRLDAEIADSTLKAPADGRVQYRIAQPGEVIGGGGKVLNLVNLSDVYMTFFLPETAVGRVGLGTEVRIVLDAAPEYVIPAKVSFVADVAQFTPKTVETESERQKLMFRVKARIDPALLRRHLAQVKTGLPGVAYVRLDPRIEWPKSLQLNAPE